MDLNMMLTKITLAPIILIKLFESIVILIIAAILIKIINTVITKGFHKQKNFKYQINEKRADTLSTLLISIVKYSFFTIAVLMILNSIFGVNIATLLAAAGIGGVAIGFGAQSLVKDVISGFFILLEDQFAVGDNITIDNMNGTVEEMEMRITKLRHFNGDLFIIPNGEIKKVVNHSRGSKTAIVDVKVSYHENLDKVINVLNNTIKNFTDRSNALLEDPKVLGVVEFSSTDIILRVTVKALPDEYIEVERELRKVIKEEFDKENIMMPYIKKVVVSSGEDMNEQ